jgi:hypothetical protein
MSSQQSDLQHCCQAVRLITLQQPSHHPYRRDGSDVQHERAGHILEHTAVCGGSLSRQELAALLLLYSNTLLHAIQVQCTLHGQYSAS